MIASPVRTADPAVIVADSWYEPSVVGTVHVDPTMPGAPWNVAEGADDASDTTVPGRNADPSTGAETVGAAGTATSLDVLPPVVGAVSVAVMR